MILRFAVPGPPVPKARARVVQRDDGAHAVTPARTKAYEQHVRTIADAAVRAFWSESCSWPLGEAYRVTMRFYRAERRGDIDNLFKSVSDAANGVLWEDDRQIREAHVYVYEDKARPRAEVEVEVIQ